MRSKIIILAVFFSFFFFSKTFALTSMKDGNTFASTGSGISWSTPSNAQTSNDVRTTATLTNTTGTSAFLKVTNFGFSIPASSTILGIQSDIEKSRASCTAGLKGIIDNSVRILDKNGNATGTDKLSVTVWPTTDATTTYGGASDLWNTGLVDTDINNSNFGVEIQAFLDAGEFPPAPPFSCQARVDHISMTITYGQAPKTVFSLPKYFTKICVEQRQFSSNILQTSTIQCYRPLKVYGSILLEFGIVATVILTVLGYGLT